MERLSSLMASLLETYEQAAGCWSSSPSSSSSGRGPRQCRPRRYASVVPLRRGASDDVVGSWLADSAHAEGVSSAALLGVERELQAHGAPAELRRRARETASAALTSARQLEAMALRWGARPRQSPSIPTTVRPLEALAAENVAQGCVGGAWGALEARYQSLSARDPVIRRAMRSVAQRGLRHAEFSSATEAWARRRLDRSARGRVSEARAGAIVELFDSFVVERDATLRVEAGLPSAATARRLVRGLCEALWPRTMAS